MSQVEAVQTGSPSSASSPDGAATTDSSSPPTSETDAAKRYFCQRCLNHGQSWPRKGHKPFCSFANCSCEKCTMVDERRRLNNAICRQLLSTDDESPSDQKSKARNPKCARCKGHGVATAIRGHKKRCPHADCRCALCSLVDERRNLMAGQIRLRRQQKSEMRQRQREFVRAAGSANQRPPSTPPQPPPATVAAAPVFRFETAPTATTTTAGGTMLPPETDMCTQAAQLHQHVQSAATNPLSAPNLHQAGFHIGAPPASATTTIYLPVQLRMPVHFPMLCPSHGCVQCLSDAVGRELQMAELLHHLAAVGADQRAPPPLQSAPPLSAAFEHEAALLGGLGLPLRPAFV